LSPACGSKVAEYVDGFVSFVADVGDVFGVCVLCVDCDAQDFVVVLSGDGSVVYLEGDLCLVFFGVRGGE